MRPLAGARLSPSLALTLAEAGLDRTRRDNGRLSLPRPSRSKFESRTSSTEPHTHPRRRPAKPALPCGAWATVFGLSCTPRLAVPLVLLVHVALRDRFANRGPSASGLRQTAELASRPAPQCLALLVLLRAMPVKSDRRLTAPPRPRLAGVRSPRPRRLLAFVRGSLSAESPTASDQACSALSRSRAGILLGEASRLVAWPLSQASALERPAGCERSSNDEAASSFERAGSSVQLLLAPAANPAARGKPLNFAREDPRAHRRSPLPVARGSPFDLIASTSATCR
jgi:hypothetical protein